MIDSTKLGQGLADCLERAGLPLSDDQEAVAIGYLAATQAQLAAHAEVVEAAKGVIESARLWSSQNYPTFDRIELEVTEALATALAKLEEAGNAH